VVLSGGPGCVHYLEDDDLAPRGMRAWYPEPRGVGRSQGGPHDLDQAVADIEAVRRAASLDSWIALGHSWGSDLAVRYALDHPDRVQSVIGVAGHGLHKDRTWSQIYESSQHLESDIEIHWEPTVHAALSASFVEWIHEPDLFRRLADSTVAMCRSTRPGCWPPRAATLFDQTGMAHQASAATAVYEARDARGAQVIADGFFAEVSAIGKPVAAVKQMPTSRCLDLSQGKVANFYCLATADRYTVEAQAAQLLDAQQKTAAQYAMLTTP
jgi:pimeloyl-ACP methyl ester carboxylesterase